MLFFDTFQSVQFLTLWRLLMYFCLHYDKRSSHLNAWLRWELYWFPTEGGDSDMAILYHSSSQTLTCSLVRDSPFPAPPFTRPALPLTSPTLCISKPWCCSCTMIISGLKYNFFISVLFFRLWYWCLSASCSTSGHSTKIFLP